jgi:hypothetical protein
MTPRISKRDRRAVIIGGLASGSALLFVLGIQPYVRALHDTRRQLMSESTLLAEEKKLLRESVGYPSIMKENEDELMREAPRLFDGSDSLSEYSSFREYIAANASSSHLFLQGNAFRNALSDSGGIMTVRVDVHASGDLRGIFAFLRLLETGRKLVNVSKLRIESTSYGAQQTAGQPDAEVLDVTATMNGFALSSPGKRH